MREDEESPDDFARRRRRQLGAFLRARRALVAPHEVGLPERSRRHVQGLRREEVAQLAGIGVSWYTLLEQGRVDHVRLPMLRRVIQTLRLSPVEADHALALALEPDGPRRTHTVPSSALQAFVRDYSGGAAFLSDGRGRIVIWNALADELFAFASYAPDERTMLALMVRSERLRRSFVDWYDALRRMIGVFRSTYVVHADRELDAFIAELRAEDRAFDTLWQAYHVRLLTAHVCRLRSDRRGELALDFMAFSPIDHPDHTIVTLRAVEPIACSAAYVGKLGAE